MELDEKKSILIDSFLEFAKSELNTTISDSELLSSIGISTKLEIVPYPVYFSDKRVEDFKLILDLCLKFNRKKFF